MGVSPVWMAVMVAAARVWSGSSWSGVGGIVWGAFYLYQSWENGSESVYRAVGLSTPCSSRRPLLMDLDAGLHW